MKKIGVILLAAVTALCCTACSSGKSGSAGESSVSNAAKKSGGLEVKAADGVDQDYIDLLKTYFEAIDHDNFADYQKTVYPPYQESYGKYLESDGSSLEQSFHEDLCTRFDEDGYDGWTLTELQIEYCPPEKEDLDDFFKAYSGAGIFDDAFVENCKKDASEMHDILFTLYALYDGDEEAVPIVTNGEIFVLKNADGAYLFG